jgi:hypothetical protein
MCNNLINNLKKSFQVIPVQKINLLFHYKLRKL